MLSSKEAHAKLLVYGLTAGKVAAGTAIFASLSLVFHGYAFFCLAWDERPISFASEEEEQLWRLFYRRSGTSTSVLRSKSWDQLVP